MITVVESYRAGLYARAHWLPNITAGVIVGIVALPLAMAFAIASGARPEQGIYTAIVGGGLVSLLGGSRLQIAGPTGAFIAILSGITAQYGLAGLQVATLMAGLMLLGMGLARMGHVIKFIPTPVILGFTAGIGVVIFLGQWPYFLGLPALRGQHFHEKLWHLVESLPQVHLPTLALALLSLWLAVYGQRIKRLKWLAHVPAPLTAMVVATVLHSLIEWEGVATIGSAFGGIPRGLPTWEALDLSLSQILTLVGPAFTIAMLGAIESLLSAVVADGMAGTRHDSNQELIGQGIANVVAPLLGGFAATGAIARTATNIRHGATSPLAGVVHALTLVAIVVFFAPLASGIPLASLAAILFVVAWNMSSIEHVMHMLKKAPSADRIILVITFVLTVFIDLVVAVNVGVIMAILHFLRRMAETVDTRVVEAPTIQGELQHRGLSTLPSDLMVYEINGPMFFGAVENFEQALLQTHTEPRMLILRLQHVPFVDATGMQTLQETMDTLGKKGVHVLLCEANPRVFGKLRKADVLCTTSDGAKQANYVETFAQALEIALSQPAA